MSPKSARADSTSPLPAPLRSDSLWGQPDRKVQPDLTWPAKGNAITEDLYTSNPFSGAGWRGAGVGFLSPHICTLGNSTAWRE